jgi:hypothetical protein
LEIGKLLETHGKIGHVTMIDGSPQFLHQLTKKYLTDNSDEDIQLKVLLRCVQLIFPENFSGISIQILALKSWEARLDLFAKMLESSKSKTPYSSTYGRKMITAIVKRIRIIVEADKIELPSLKFTSITLFKPKIAFTADLDEDYGLGKYTSKSINCIVVDGSHATVLKNSELLNIANC